MAPQTFNNSSLDYTVSLSNGASLYFDGLSYDITDIFGFYAVGNDFTATGYALENGAWKWVTKTSPEDLAGWTNNNKSNAITQGGSMTFTFASLLVNEPPPVMGLHVRLALGGNASPFGSGETGFIIPSDGSNPNPVPEPGTILAALSILAPVGMTFRRRKA